MNTETKLSFSSIAHLDEIHFIPIDVDALESFDDFPKANERQAYFFTSSYNRKFTNLITAYSLKGVNEGEVSSYHPIENPALVRNGLLGYIHGRPLITDLHVSPAWPKFNLDGFYIVNLSEESLISEDARAALEAGAAALTPIMEREDEPVAGGQSLYAEGHRVAKPRPVTDRPFFVRADVQEDVRNDGLGDEQDWAAEESYTPQQVAILNFERLVDAEVEELTKNLFGTSVDNGVLRAYVSDAMRYRALHQERMRYLGSAGLMNEHIKENGSAHIGLELWTLTGEVSEKMRPVLEDQHRRAVEMLNVYTAISAVVNADKCGFVGTKKG